MDEPRRIVWLIHGSEGYGVGRAVASLISSVRAAGWTVSVVALTDGSLAARGRGMGIAVTNGAGGAVPGLSGGVASKMGGVIRLLLYHRRVAGEVIEALRPLRPDAVHVLWPNLVSIAGAAAKRLGAPCFWEMPNVLGRYPLGANRLIYQAICSRYGIVPLANSRHTAASLGHFPLKPRVIYLGVDPERFDPDKVVGVPRERLGIPANALVLGVFARMGKGQDRVLEAMLALPDADPPLHLLLLGGPVDDPFADGLRAVAQRAGAANRLHVPGAVDDPEAYYQAVDVAVNFAAEAESFGLSVVEAMMMNKPVLVHAAGGPAETVIDGVTGWHVNDPSVASLADGLRRVLADRGKWPEMGAAARRRALEHFSLSRQTRDYMEVVEGVLRARGR
jgi:glycosyltransferase involved in cell wall biosynthesis